MLCCVTIFQVPKIVSSRFVAVDLTMKLCTTYHTLERLVGHQSNGKMGKMSDTPEDFLLFQHNYKLWWKTLRWNLTFSSLASLAGDLQAVYTAPGHYFWTSFHNKSFRYLWIKLQKLIICPHVALHFLKLVNSTGCPKKMHTFSHSQLPTGITRKPFVRE